MKVIICFPPLNSEKGFPTLGQNRQFQYFKTPTYIYPVVPATAATLLAKNDFDTLWLDCIAQNITLEKFLEIINQELPDIIAMETKTPVIRGEWEVINRLKLWAKNCNRELKIVLFGDHVTALPEESLQNSYADFILTGGDYDFLLLNLCKALREAKASGANLNISQLESGIYYREDNKIKSTGVFNLNHDLNTLPFIDRKLTNWQLYAYKNGNYRRTPGTYIMSGRDCWWGKCTFCSWPQLYPKFRSRTVNNVVMEIEHLVNEFKVKEIMDDTGTFPCGQWLNDFCKAMIEKGLNKKVNLDCNMRFGAVDFNGYKMMRDAGFRFLLFGIESANQKTLDKINKNLKVETIISSCKQARKAGLYPHITLMFGYPWEDYQDAKNTLELGKFLLKKGYAYTMQATLVIPYPKTGLFLECQDNNWLTSLDWNDYDMKQPVMKISYPKEELLSLIQSIYSVSFSPEFIFRKVISIRDWTDIVYFSRAFFKVLGHIIDFKAKGSNNNCPAQNK